MPVSPLSIDLGAILHLAIFEASGIDTLPIVGRLPSWWVQDIGVLNSNNELKVHSPFLLEFLTDARQVWKSDTDATLSSALFEVGAALVQAMAVRHGSKNLLILRDLHICDDWLTPTLQSARSNLIQHERERVAHVRQVADITADRDEAFRREQLKSRVLANLSHEIRTPLATILGMVNAAQADHSAKADYLKAISSAANQMLALGNDILDLSKMQAERLELDAEPFSLLQFMQELDLQWKTLALDRQIEFQTKLAPNLPAQVTGDVVRLRQVLSNLVANAMKFTPRGSVTVELDRSVVQANSLRFTIVDTGVGILQKDLPFIFEAFTQVDACKKKRHEGAGLGLAIAGRLVRLMGGEICVESEPGKGSRFWFEANLPASTVEKTDQDSGIARSSPCQDIHVLVAEDHDLNRSIIVEMLVSAGATVTDVANGKEAVEECSAKRFDIILLDCQMPVMDGLTATAKIRNPSQANSLTPIIVLTAHAPHQGQEITSMYGTNRCLTKPIEAEELVRHVLDMTKRQARQM